MSAHWVSVTAALFRFLTATVSVPAAMKYRTPIRTPSRPLHQAGVHTCPYGVYCQMVMFMVRPDWSLLVTCRYVMSPPLPEEHRH
jgi:hypothetical protein